MTDTLLANENAFRLSVFLGMLALMALWEMASPRRRQDVPRLLRWSNNFAMVVIDTIAVRLVFPILAVGMAYKADELGTGILNWISVPDFWAVLIALIVLDLVIYAQHVAFHKIPILWRLHRMHHADLEFDASTALRFHPLEIILSMALKLLVVILLGAPPIAVLLFEVILNASAIFNHSNIKMPRAIDAVLRLFIVTPDMHRVHHSIHQHETDSNYGFNLPWWDWIFGTYIAQPMNGHVKMRIGLERFRSKRELWLDRMLLQPLRRNGFGQRNRD